MNRQQKNAIEKIPMWKKSTATSLNQVYGKHSKAKDEAFSYCRNLCYDHKGTDLKIVTHNVNIFTAGFQYTDTDTGVLMFMLITPSYNCSVEM